MKEKKHKFRERLKATISKQSMLSGGETVLVGLSGGPDSVCLLHVLRSLRDEFSLKLHAVYLDHGLRPDETPSEIAFCKTLCEKLSVPLIIKVIDVKSFAREQELNKQEAARQLRYWAFDEISFSIKADRIALGHNADDQVETFLMRLLRGTGPKGLSGIPPVRKNIIRPLIETERSEIECYLDENRINYIVDSSNLKDDYLRNKLRHLFIPELKKINPSMTMTTAKTMDILREEEKYFEILVTKTLMRLISRKTDKRIELFLVPMEAMEKVTLRRVLRRAIDETKGLRGVGFVHIEDIIDLIKQGQHGDRLNLPKGLRVIKNYSLLIITSEIPHRVKEYALAVPGEVALTEIRTVISASLEETAGNFGDGKTVVVLDADKTGNLLRIRPREKGDSFYPVGFGKKKKLQDFFVDEKVSRDERDIIPIITAGSDIIWIAGYRADERFKVTANTRSFLKLEIVSSAEVLDFISRSKENR